MQRFTNAECASRGRQGNLAAAPNAMPILQRLQEIKEKVTRISLRFICAFFRMRQFALAINQALEEAEPTFRPALVGGRNCGKKVWESMRQWLIKFSNSSEGLSHFCSSPAKKVTAPIIEPI
jgi:hypothetical protein